MNKYAIITGGAKGIGFAIAKKCLQKGLDVVLIDIDSTALEKAKQELKEFDGVHAEGLDICDSQKIKAFAKEVLNQLGPPSYLFNNAGIGGDMQPLWEQSLESVKQTMDVNFFSAFNLTKAFVPAMIEANTQGTIVNIASMASFYTAPLISSYVISKHSMMAFSECLYHDLNAINSKLQVAVVCPGGVKTTIVDENLNQKASYETNLSKLNAQSQHFMIKFAKLIKKGINPATAAEIIFTGLEHQQFYIFTHPEMIPIVEQRFKAVLNQKQPQPLGL